MNILIISSNPFSKTDNNGKTLEAIFSSFNSKNLYQLFLRPQINNIDLDYCKSYYCVSEVDIINKILRKTSECGKEITYINEEFAKSSEIFTSIPRNSIKRNPILRDLLWKTNLWKTSNLLSWIKSTNADLIFCVGGGNSYIHDISLYISKLTNCPLAIYFTDDYILSPECKTLVEKIMKYRRHKFYKRSISHSKLRFCIGDEMVKAYSEYFKCSFYPIMNSVDIRDYPQLKYAPILNISYFGGLHLGRLDAILKVARCLPKNAKLTIYSFSKISKEDHNRLTNYNVILKNGIQGNELINKMEESHVLLHIESGNQIFRKLTKFSLSTKIPEYLITGRPIIAVGPKEVASIKFLDQNKIGYIISIDDSEDEITKQLTSILDNFKSLELSGKLGYDFAIKNFNKDVIANNFKMLITSIIK